MSDSKLKISIITVCFNSKSTIADTLESVEKQSYSNIEHIVVDGGSTDGTKELVNKFPHIKKFISEKDNGMYDAMNKGILLSTGDYVVILNSDDFYHSNSIIEEAVNFITKVKTDCILGDAIFVSQKDVSKKVRFYSCKKWRPELFKWGFMPSHPSFFVKREMYKKYGLYRTDYKICADYELLIRFLYTNRISYIHFDKTVLTMRLGGVSNASISNRILLNKEIVKACKAHGINSNLVLQVIKLFRKLGEFIFIPKTI